MQEEKRFDQWTFDTRLSHERLMCAYGICAARTDLFAMSIKDISVLGIQLFLTKQLVATKICGLYDDIMAMPEGFDTLIEKRALYQAAKTTSIDGTRLVVNPEILMLDDSLSAVDAKTEHLILENLKRERSDKTTMITAHRLSAIVHGPYHRTPRWTYC